MDSEEYIIDCKNCQKVYWSTCYLSDGEPKFCQFCGKELIKE